MENHKRLHHGKETIPCPHSGCSYVSKNKDQATLHEKNHIMATCEICGYLTRRYSMPRHMRTHGIGKVHYCSYSHIQQSIETPIRITYRVAFKCVFFLCSILSFVMCAKKDLIIDSHSGTIKTFTLVINLINAHIAQQPLLALVLLEVI